MSSRNTSFSNSSENTSLTTGTSSRNTSSSTSTGNISLTTATSPRNTSSSTSTENISLTTATSSRNTSFSNSSGNISLTTGYFGNYQLLGDSQFVRLSKEILNLRSTLNSDRRPQIGFCISGQTSTELATLIAENYEYLGDDLIIMIGTNDVKNRVTRHEFRTAIRSIRARLEWKNILWLTIPPIPKFFYSSLHMEKLKYFNEEIKKMQGNNIKILDAYSWFVEENGTPKEYCFEKYYESKTLPYRQDNIHLNKSGLIKLMAWLCFHLLPQKLNVIKKYRERMGSAERSKIYNEFHYLATNFLPNSSGFTREDLYYYFMDPGKFDAMPRRNLFMRWISMAPADDVSIKIHSEYQVTFRPVPGGAHLCNQLPVAKIPKMVSPLPWASNYQAKPSNYDLSVIQNTYDFYIDNYISWKAAQNEQHEQRTQNMERVMRQYMREIRKRGNPEESSSDEENEVDIFNHYISPPYELISMDQTSDLIPDLQQNEDGTYLVHLPDMETEENFQDIAEEASHSVVDQRCSSPEINVCDTDDEESVFN